MHIDKAIQLAYEHYQAGNLQWAEEICREILKVQPDNAHVYNNLGIILDKKGQIDEAITCYRSALQFDPTLFDVYYNLGNALKEKNQLDEAIINYRKALQLNPNLCDAYINLGIALKGKHQLDEALTCYQKALQINPDNASAYYNLGITLQMKGQLDEAIKCYQRALQLNLDVYYVYNNLGLAFLEKGQFDEAITCHQKALEMNPNYSDAHNNLGWAFYNKGQFDEAIHCYRRALELDPDNPRAHWNISLYYLLTGNFTEGWKEYEWRWKLGELEYHARQDFPQLAWDGSNLEGKKLFIYTEQGVGDEIMFASCLPEVIAQADLCIVECDKRMVPLFSRSFPKAKVIEQISTYGTYPEELPRADLKVAIGSMPLFLRPSLSSFPQRHSYIIPDVQRVSLWRDRYANLREGLKIGISWRGGQKPYVQLTRSTALEQWSKLFSIKEAHFINLQYGDCTAEIKEIQERLGVTIHDWEDADPLKDLDGFAAQIAALDLVITVDNATVHMAGALGVPVWVLLSYACEWRWMLQFEDTPWYTSVRLFRQSSFGDWDGVFEHVYDALKNAVADSHVSMEQWRRSLKQSYQDAVRLTNTVISKAT
jgi:tetratricopeptide (TPR) repeat protein